MMNVGPIPTGFRQECSAALASKIPKKTGVTYIPTVDPATKIIQFADPTDPSLKSLDQGGLYDFGENTVIIKEVRGPTAAGNITVIVGDRDNALHDVAIGTPATGRTVFAEPLIILPSQVLKIATASAGWVDVYAVKGVGYY